MTVMMGSEALIEILRKENVEFIFGVPGTTEFPILDALEKCPEIDYVLALHESVAIGMAEGYSRASGKVGIVNLHTILGVASALPLLVNAHEGGVPLILICGQQNTNLLMQEPELTGDLKGLADQFTKWGTEIIHAIDIPVALRRAFKVVNQAPKGPVLISFPIDMQTNKLEFSYSPSSSTIYENRSSDHIIKEGAELLARAESPTIVVGCGVSDYDAISEVVKLAEMTGARVYNQWMADMDFPTGHPQYLQDICGLPGPDMGEIFHTTDVFVVIGAPLFRRQQFNPEAPVTDKIKFIHITDDPWQIGRNFPIAIGMEGNIKTTVSALVTKLESGMPESVSKAVTERINNIAIEKKNLIQSVLSKNEKEMDNRPISISRLMKDIGESINPETIVVDECWSSGPPLRQYMDFNIQGGYYRIRDGGTLGWGMPASVGIKIANPDRQVVAILGDGSTIFSPQALWVAAHYHIPITFVICANGGYRLLKMIKLKKMPFQSRQDFLGMDIDKPTIDFVQLAQSMGVPGIFVEEPQNIKKALQKAFSSDGPMLVEVRLEEM